MFIHVLKVSIGSRTEELHAVSVDDPNVAFLLEHAISKEQQVWISVPPTDANAALLGQLEWGETGRQMEEGDGTLHVSIGPSTVNLSNINMMHPHVRALIEAADPDDVRTQVKISVPRTADVASALGRLTFGAEEEAETEISAHIPVLSQKVTELDFDTRLMNLLTDKANIVYIWQLVERSQAEVFKIRGLGQGSLGTILKTLEALNLTLGMKLTSIRDRLPTT